MEMSGCNMDEKSDAIIDSPVVSQILLENTDGNDRVVVSIEADDVATNNMIQKDAASDAYQSHTTHTTVDSLGNDNETDEILNKVALINQQYDEQQNLFDLKSTIEEGREMSDSNVRPFHLPSEQQNDRNAQNYNATVRINDEATQLDQPGENLDPPAQQLVEAFPVQNNPNENDSAVVIIAAHQEAADETIIASVATPTVDPPNRLPLLIVVTIVLVSIIVGISVYFISQQNIGSETLNPSSSPVNSSAVDKVCFESTYELRNAVITYLDGDDDVKRTYGNQIGSWCVGRIQDFSYLFNGIDLEPFFNQHAIDFNEDIGQWNTSSASTMNMMFAGATAFNQDISRWDVSKVRDLRYMFQDATGFNQNLSSWNVSAVTAMGGLFAGAVLFNGDISPWDVSSVPNMEIMFYEASSFNQDIVKWDVSKVTKMYGMFSSASAFNQNLSSWNVSRVTEMSQMFLSASKFNQDISSWDVSKVTLMDSMFQDAITFNQNVSSWNVSAVTNMAYLFYNASEFNQDITSWDVSNVVSMDAMFHLAENFNQDLSSWDVSKVTTMVAMFQYSVSFNQNLSPWNVSAVTRMDYMFYNASDFNQNISSWDVSSVVRMDYMFAYTSSFSQDLCPWGELLFVAGTNSYSMFESANSCPNNADPDLNDDPPGPLCHVCT